MTRKTVTVTLTLLQAELLSDIIDNGWDWGDWATDRLTKTEVREAAKAINVFKLARQAAATGGGTKEVAAK